MNTITQSFDVSFSYPVIFTQSVWSLDNPTLLDCLARDTNTKPPYRTYIVLDSGVDKAQPLLREQITAWFEHHATHATLIAPIKIVPGGEMLKSNHGIVFQLIRHAVKYKIGRKDTIIAIGGGSVQDLVGFAAALIHRGCHFIRINSTTLAQDDAGVGVKNGVDVASIKNFAGTFAPPFAVINDSSLLTTLSDTDWISGVAESVKVATIKDAAFFHELEALAPAIRRRDLTAMQRVIYKTASLHLRHIATHGDPFEAGNARPLDFGHWAAHRLESMSCYQLTHGIAVGIGIALDTLYAREASLLSPSDCESILSLLESLGLPIYTAELQLCGADGRLSVLDGLRLFQEHLGGDLNITLPTSIGNKTEVHTMDESIIKRVILALANRHASHHT